MYTSSSHYLSPCIYYICSLRICVAPDYLWKPLFEERWGTLKPSSPYTSSSHVYESIPWYKKYSTKQITEANWTSASYDKITMDGHEKFIVSVAFMDEMVVSSSGMNDTSLLLLLPSSFLSALILIYCLDIV